MKMKPTLIIMAAAAQIWCGTLALAQSQKMVGSWTIEITFGNGDSRSLRFDARDAGKGSFISTNPKSQDWGMAKPSEAKWSQTNDQSVTFSGPMEFPIGNVGRDAGILEFKGKFETEGLIKGEVTFSPLVGDGPSKGGTFKAIRVPGDKSP